MRAELLCSCGLLLEHAGSRILIDAPNGAIPPFYRLPEPVMQELLSASGRFSNLCGLFFTHRHLDHCDPQRVEALLRARGSLSLFMPEADMPETVVVTAGPFTVECHRFPHICVPKIPDAAHFVLLVTAGASSVYVTADAALDVQRHLAILNGRIPDAAFWNSQYLSYPETRALLREHARQNYVYHMPEGPADPSGIRRKCARNFERHAAELPNVTPLLDYPAALSLRMP